MPSFQMEKLRLEEGKHFTQITEQGTGRHKYLCPEIAHLTTTKDCPL